MDPIRGVLSYPPRHDYVDRLHGGVATLVHRDQPWPRLPDLYDPGWIDANAGGWDLAHLHFGWEQYPPDRVAAVLDVHRDAGVPIVWTAHDLRNPHTQGPGDEHYLRLLAERADAVVTLTAGAAGELARRFGRDAQVIEHGPLLDARPERVPRRGAIPRVLLHAKSLRANLDVGAAVRAARAAVADGAEVELLVAAHDEPQVRAELRAVAGPGVRVAFHPPWDAAELVTAIAGADALLLPYRWGTHSGMVELATDIGTPVIASDVGYLAEQAPMLTVPVVAGRIDEEALAETMAQLAHGRQLPPVVAWEERMSARRRFLEAHRRLYGELIT